MQTRQVPITNIMIFTKWEFFLVSRNLLKIIHFWIVLQMKVYEPCVVSFSSCYWIIATIKQRRKSQNIKLDISVSSTPQSKKDRVSLLESSKIDPVVPDSSLVYINQVMLYNRLQFSMKIHFLSILKHLPLFIQFLMFLQFLHHNHQFL